MLVLHPYIPLLWSWSKNRWIKKKTGMYCTLQWKEIWTHTKTWIFCMLVPILVYSLLQTNIHKNLLSSAQFKHTHKHTPCSKIHSEPKPSFQEKDALRLTVAFVPFVLPLRLQGHDILWFISFKDKPWKWARLCPERAPFNYFLQKGIFGM